MDAFRRGALLMLGSARGVAAEYRAQGTGLPVPCRILLLAEPDDTARPGISSGKLVACGHLDAAAGLVAVARRGTFTVAGRPPLEVEQVGKPELGWDWRVYLKEGA